MEFDFIPFMDKLIKGLHRAIENKQCPEVLFILGWIVGLRANDQNEAHDRKNDRNCDSNSHCVLSDATTSDGQDVTGTIAVLHPSKGRDHHSFTTVFICDAEHYPLITRAIAFVHSPEITRLPCTSCVGEYKRKTPSGPDPGQKWGSAKRGIFKQMLEELDACLYD
jgi:hypothetical protein